MLRLLCFLFACLLGSSGMAQELASASGVAISVQDLEIDLQRLPPEVRATAFSIPEAVQSNVANMLVRRVLAAEAVKAGLDKEASVQTALNLARDRILSDARLAAIDKASQPETSAIEAYAQSTYKVNPKRFEVPEQVRIRHILLRLAGPDARDKAEKMLKDLKAGADFDQLAKTNSQDPGSAPKGGDLGWVARGRMVKPFEDAAFGLKQVGDLSEVVETTFGFHIIKLDERRAAGVKSFEEVREALIKEAQSTLVNNARLKEQDRILSNAKFDTAAIEAIAKSQRN